jgi:hypothetical protein
MVGKHLSTSFQVLEEKMTNKLGKWPIQLYWWFDKKELKLSDTPGVVRFFKGCRLETYKSLGIVILRVSFAPSNLQGTFISKHLALEM